MATEPATVVARRLPSHVVLRRAVEHLATLSGAAPYTWEFCRSCGGAGWVGARLDHEHPSCGHRCILCDPPPGYDRTYALDASDA